MDWRCVNDEFRRRSWKKWQPKVSCQFYTKCVKHQAIPTKHMSVVDKEGMDEYAGGIIHKDSLLLRQWEVKAQ